MANNKDHKDEKTSEETVDEDVAVESSEGEEDVEESEKGLALSVEEAASDDEEAASDDDDEEVAATGEDEETASEDEPEVVTGGDGGEAVVPAIEDPEAGPGPVAGIAAFFDLPDELMLAAAHTRDSKWNDFEAFSPFPIHGMDDAMGLGRSWIPWVTFGAGSAGLMTAIAMQFGMMTFDWPMIIGGKPYAPWPSFVPVMFELTVLFAGCITALVMLIAAGCFRKPLIIDPELTQDRFALWISANDEAFDLDEIKEFMKSLDPVEIRTITAEA